MDEIERNERPPFEDGNDGGSSGGDIDDSGFDDGAGSPDGSGTRSEIGGSGRSGETRRKRGRPRKEENSEEILVSPSRAVTRIPASAKTRPTKFAPSPEEVANTIAALCNIVAAIRGPHWNMTTEHALPFGTSVSDVVAKMPEKQRKALQNLGIPFQLTIGAALTFGPIVSAEIKIHETMEKIKKEKVSEVKPSIQGTPKITNTDEMERAFNL